MKQFKVKTEYAPERCEICHQSDLFEPIRNQCQRCSLEPIKHVFDDLWRTHRGLARTRVLLDRLERTLMILCFAALGCMGIWIILNLGFSSWYLLHFVNNCITGIAVLILVPFIFATLAKAFLNSVEKEIVFEIVRLSKKRD